jgi:uncharacterized protein (DUF2236 family)
VGELPGTDVVARTLRKILSGSADGRPPWLRALEEPGDAGWFGPGHAIWTVHGSIATLVGGIRALLLQSVHPHALAGVEQHSDYRADPLGRLQRTNQWLTSVTFGSSEQADLAIRRVSAVHQRVAGIGPDGRPYAATDPRLLLWVHVGLADSMLAAALALEPQTVDPDAYVADMAVVGRRMGIANPPESAAELAGVLDGFRPELRGGPAVREVTQFLSRPPLPAPVLPFYGLLHRAAVDLLPTWSQDLLGNRRRSAPARAVDLVLTSSVLGGLRLALGHVSPGEAAARRRIEMQASGTR